MKYNHKDKFLFLFLLWYLKKKSSYGYLLVDEISKSINSNKSSNIYLALSKMEKLGLITCQEEEVDNRVRKLYTTSKKGSTFLDETKKKKVIGKMREFFMFLQISRKIYQ